MRDIQVLCPINQGDSEPFAEHRAAAGSRIREEKPKVEKLETTFAIGDKVMQIENDYDKEVYNSNLRFGRSHRSRTRRGDDRFRWTAGRLCVRDLDQIVLAYATTIHEQGSGHGLIPSSASLEAEILTLHHQLNVLRRKSPKRLAFSNLIVWFLLASIGLSPHIVNAFSRRRYAFSWLSCFVVFRSGGEAADRPKVPLEIRQLIRAMSLANRCGALPGIHGELLKLGIDVGQTSVAKYMARHRRPPSQGGKTFLRKTAPMASNGSLRRSDTPPVCKYGKHSSGKRPRLSGDAIGTVANRALSPTLAPSGAKNCHKGLRTLAPEQTSLVPLQECQRLSRDLAPSAPSLVRGFGGGGANPRVPAQVSQNTTQQDAPAELQAGPRARAAAPPTGRDLATIMKATGGSLSSVHGSPAVVRKKLGLTCLREDPRRARLRYRCKRCATRKESQGRVDPQCLAPVGPQAIEAEVDHVRSLGIDALRTLWRMTFAVPAAGPWQEGHRSVHVLAHPEQSFGR